MTENSVITTKHKNIHTVRVRVPLHLLNVLERAAVTENKNISKVVRELIAAKL
jgi:hypothetical protein